MWFANSFGISLESLHGHTTSGQKISIKLGESSSQGTTTTVDDEHTQILQVLYLLDKFGVGDALYHEMSIIALCLPRSYKIKHAQLHCGGNYTQCQDSMVSIGSLTAHARSLVNMHIM